MSKIAFGFHGFKMPTPTRINFYARGSAIIGGVLISAINTAPFHLSDSFKAYSGWFIGVIVGLANGLAPLFGVQTTQQQINVADVSAMDENALKK